MVASMLSVRARLAAAVGRVVSGRILSTSTLAGRGASRRMPPRIEALEDRLLMTICPDQPSVPQLTPPPPCPANQLVISGDPSEAGQEGQPSVTSEAPVRLFDGMPTIDSTDLSSDGFGKDWSITRSWAGFDNTGQVGNGWMIKGLPYLVVQATYDTPTNYPILTAVDGGQTQRSFVLNTSTSTFSPLFFCSQDNLTYTPATSTAPGEFQLTDASGGVTRYYDVPRDSTNAISTLDTVGYALEPTNHSGSHTGFSSYYQYGAFKSYTDPDGNTTTATYDSSTGNLLYLERSDAGTGASERFAFSYATISNSLGGSASMISSIALQRLVSGSWQTVQSAAYTYYTGELSPGVQDTNGRLGDLKQVDIKDPSGNVIGSKYYRYDKATGYEKYGSQGPTNTPNTTGGPTALDFISGDTTVFSALRTVVEGPSLARLAAANSSYQGASDAALQPYVDHYFQYERWADGDWSSPWQTDGNIGYHMYTRYRATEEVANNAGCSCSGGQGTYQFQYAINQDDQDGAFGNQVYDPNVWRMKTTEFLPSDDSNLATHDRNVTFLNEVGQPLLSDQVSVDKTAWSISAMSVASIDATTHDATIDVTASGHPFNTGDVVALSGISVSLATGDTEQDLNTVYNGLFTVTRIDANTFSFTLSNKYFHYYYDNHTAAPAPVVGSSSYAAKVLQQALNAYRYDAQGRMIQQAMPSAVSGYSESQSDPVDKLVSGTLVQDGWLNTSSGLIDLYNYATTTTATTATAGDVAGYLMNQEVQQGTGGTPVLLSSTRYIANTDANGVTIYLPARTTGYAGTGGTGSRTTTSLYTFYPNTNEVQQVIVGQPPVTSAQNGADVASQATASGSTTTLVDSALSSTTGAYVGDMLVITGGTDTGQAAIVTAYDGSTHTLTFSPALTTATDATSVFTLSAEVSYTVDDVYGRPIWTRDADGHVNGTEYDMGTGAVTKSIVDVNYADLSTAEQSTFPSGWAHPSGLNLVTQYTVDGLGRTTEEISPNINVTYTVYNDANHETRVYPGFNATTGLTTGPIEISRQYWPAAGSGNLYYTETLTSTATPHLTGGVPDGTETLSASNIASLQRDFTNDGGQLSWSDKYVTLGTYSYSQTVSLSGGVPADIGVSGTNFYRTSDYYDSRGRLDRTDEPTGTIDWTVFDYLGRPSSKWVGTDYVALNSGQEWSPFNQNVASGSNLMMVEQFGYDTTAAPAQPSVGSTSTTAPNTTYYVTETYIINGVETPASEEASAVLSNSSGALRISSPPSVTGATGYNVYISTSPGQERLQNTGGPIAIGTEYDYFAGTTLQTTTAAAPLSGVGDGNLTRDTQFPGLGALPRLTLALYDWRDRPVLTKAGVQTGSEFGTGVHRPITYTTYDNLGEATQVDRFDGDNVDVIGLGSTSGVPNAPSSSLLVARTVNSYDDQGRVYKTEVKSVASGGTVSTGLVTNYFYDTRGLLAATYNPGSTATMSVYDGAGRLVTQYITDGGATNNSGAPLLDWSDATNTSGTMPDDVLSQTEYTYDDDGNVTFTVTRDRFDNDATTATGPLGTPTSGVGARVYYLADYYDAADRLTDEVNAGTNNGSLYPRSGSVPPGSDTLLVTHTDYTAAGNVEDVIDPKGLATDYAYDMLGRKLQESDGIGSGSWISQTNWTYDGNDDVLTAQGVYPGTSTPAETTAYSYGVGGTAGTNLFSNDLIAKVEYPTKSGIDAGQPNASDAVSYGYDLLGERVGMTDRMGTTHAYTFDVLGRMVDDLVTTFGSGVSTANGAELAYTFNALGLLYTAKVLNGSGTTINQVEDLYNGLGQLVTQQENYGTTTASVQYAYDTAANGSRLLKMTYPSGYVLHYGYDNNALDNAIGRVDYLADDNGSGGIGQHTEEYSYLGLDTIVTRNRPQEGVELTYAHQSGDTLSSSDGGDQYTGLDRFGRVIDQWWYDPATSATVARFQYGYDRDSNVSYKKDLVTSANDELYAYDNAAQLTSFDVGTLNSGRTALTGTPVSTWSVTLDALGNRTSIDANGTTTSSTFDSQNEQNTYGSSNLAYNSAGEMTTDQNGNSGYDYDAWGRLVYSSVAANFYTYDALGRRITSDGSELLYYSADGRVIEDRAVHSNGSGGYITDSTTRYIWGKGYVNQLVLRDEVSTSTRTYALQDANYNVVAITDSSGTVLDRYGYDQDGNVRSGTPSTNSWLYLWQGMRRVSIGTGSTTTYLYESQGRFYNAGLGTWVTPDPAGYVDGLNYYRAFDNASVNTIDPAGLDALWNGSGGGSAATTGLTHITGVLGEGNVSQITSGPGGTFVTLTPPAGRGPHGEIMSPFNSSSGPSIGADPITGDPDYAGAQRLANIFAGVVPEIYGMGTLDAPFSSYTDAYNYIDAQARAMIGSNKCCTYSISSRPVKGWLGGTRTRERTIQAILTRDPSGDIPAFEGIAQGLYPTRTMLKHWKWTSTVQKIEDWLFTIHIKCGILTKDVTQDKWIASPVYADDGNGQFYYGMYGEGPAAGPPPRISRPVLPPMPPGGGVGLSPVE